MIIIIVHDKEWNYKLCVLAENTSSAISKGYLKLKEIYNNIYIKEEDLVAEYCDCNELVI